MNIVTFARSTFVVSAAAGLLAGCSGARLSPTAAGPSSTAINDKGQHPNFSLLRVGMVSQHLDRRPSHMSKEAKSGTLLYVSDPGTGSVQVFSYPKGASVGTLTGFSYVQGACSDSSGDVYVVDTSSAEIFKYAHGGTSPIALLSDPGQLPLSCAVDPNTGNLAVSNLLANSQFEIGSISVYPAGSSTPTVYTDPDFAREYYIAYDNNSNVYVDGIDSKSNTFRFSKMTPDGTFTEIPLKGAKITFPGGVQVIGDQVAVGDQDGAVWGTPDVYRATMAGKVVGKMTLATASGGRVGDLTEFTLTPAGEPKQIIAPDAIGATVYLNKWPKGGYGSSITGGLVNPLGTTLSAPPK